MMFNYFLPAIFSISTLHNFPAEQRLEKIEFIKLVKDFAREEDPSNTPLFELLNNLETSPAIIQKGRDSESRPVFVNAQADFERAMIRLIQSGQITTATWMIHTPAPATPLCTNGEVSSALVDPSLLSDPERLLTVMKRPDLIREYLKTGQKLVSIYSQGGRSIRTSEQLAILDHLRETFPNLSTIELDEEISKDLIGATYLFTMQGKTYFFSLKSYQANAPSDDQWGIWFDNFVDPVIQKRFREVFIFFLEALKKEGALPPLTQAQVINS